MVRLLGKIYKKEQYQTIDGDHIYIVYSVNEENIFCAAALHKEEEMIIARCLDEEIINYKIKLYLEERGIRK